MAFGREDIALGETDAHVMSEVGRLWPSFVETQVDFHLFQIRAYTFP